MKSQFRGFLFEAKHLTGLLVAAATVARTPLHGGCRRWTKYGIGAVADSAGARETTRRPQQKLRWETAVLGPAFVGTPRRSLRRRAIIPKTAMRRTATWRSA